MNHSRVGLKREIERSKSAKLRSEFSSKGSKVDHGIKHKAVRKVRAVFKKTSTESQSYLSGRPHHQ